MTDLLDRKLLIVTGKGGTGKSTVAAALARLAARQQKRVLLVETDGTRSIGEPFGLADVQYEPTEVEPGLFVMVMETEKALSEYMALNMKIPFASRMGALAKAFDFLATAAPGVREILTMGKIAWDVKRETYDLVVVDAAATGHIVSQIGAPDSIGDLVTVGPLTGQTQWMKDMFRDEARTGAIIVTTPEEMPVSESISLIDTLRTQTQTPIAAVVVNRVLPELFVRDEAAIFEVLQQPQHVEQLVHAAGAAATGVIEAARLGASLRRSQVRHLDLLRQKVDGATPFVFIPQVFGISEPAAVTIEATESLAEELG